jgi:hypothetical protein
MTKHKSEDYKLSAVKLKNKYPKLNITIRHFR